MFDLCIVLLISKYDFSAICFKIILKLWNILYSNYRKKIHDDV